MRTYMIFLIVREAVSLQHVPTGHNSLIHMISILSTILCLPYSRNVTHKEYVRI